MRRCLIYALVCLAGNSASAQHLSPNRTDAFRLLLHAAQLTPLSDFEALFESPKGKILILLGDPNKNELEFQRHSLSDFLRKGGAVLIASNRPTPSRIAGQLGCRVDGHLVIGPNHDGTAVYRGKRECLFLREPTQVNLHEQPFGNMLRQVATNQSSYLILLQQSNPGFFSSRWVVAGFPQGFMVDFDPLPQLGDPRHQFFAIAGQNGLGRYMVMADQSLFTNAMMVQTDNENIAFAMATVNWLKENGKRSEVLFVDEGMIRSEFDINLDTIDPPLPHPDVLGPAIDKVMIQLENENVFNRMINELLPINRLFRGLLLGATGLLTCWALYRMTAGRLRLDARTARLPDKVEELADTTGIIERRARDLARSDLADPARELARRFFEELDIVTEKSTELRIVSTSGILSRLGWSRRVRAMWAVAIGLDSEPVPPERLQQIAGQLDELRAATMSGELRLQGMGPDA